MIWDILMLVQGGTGNAMGRCLVAVVVDHNDILRLTRNCTRA